MKIDGGKKERKIRTDQTEKRKIKRKKKRNLSMLIDEEHAHKLVQREKKTRQSERQTTVKEKKDTAQMDT